MPPDVSPLDLLSDLLGDAPDLAHIADAETWSVVRANARRHGVAPLVASIARPHLKGPERAWCDRILATGMSRHLKSIADLEAALNPLDKAGVPCLVLKGPVLALRHYEAPWLRKPSVDVDLAVAAADLEGAVAAFAREGYRPAVSPGEASARSHHVELKREGRTGIELHFRLSHGAYGIPVEGFFPRCVSFPLPGGRVVQVLSPADEILHLVLHRAHGRFALLFHLYEIRKLWRAAQPEVKDRVLQLAAEHRFTGPLLLTEQAFRLRWNEPFLPEGVKAPATWLSWRVDRRFYERFERLSDPGRDLPLGARLARRWLDFELTDRPQDAVRFAGILARVAWYQIRNRGWRTVRVGSGPGFIKDS